VTSNSHRRGDEASPLFEAGQAAHPASEAARVGHERWRDARQQVASHRVEAVRTRLAASRSPLVRLADTLTRTASSAPFLLAHVAWFAAWITWNATLAQRMGRSAFDPYPFGFLTLVVSLEAIVLTIFVLMSQRRESRIAELREELTLEIDMRTEEEVTKTLQLVAGLYTRLGLPLVGNTAELRAMLLPLDREEIARQLSEQVQEGEAAVPPAPETPVTEDGGGTS
jgi:uncharacterized membrane protein